MIKKEELKAWVDALPDGCDVALLKRDKSLVELQRGNRLTPNTIRVGGKGPSW